MTNVTPEPARPTPPQAPAKTDSAPDSPPIQARTAAPDTVPNVQVRFAPLTTQTAAPAPTAPETLITSPLTGEDFDFVLPDTETQLRIQEALADKGLYPGRKNGKWGNLSVASIQQSVNLRPTGAPSAELVKAVFVATDREGDSKLDQAVWADFAQTLENK